MQQSLEIAPIGGRNGNLSKLPFYLLLMQDGHRISNRAGMARAFALWKFRLPLQLKCIELEEQMKERALTIATVRDHYLRDVVSIKYHMEQVINAATKIASERPRIESAEEGELESCTTASSLMEHLSEVAGVPSLSLANLIATAKNSTKPSSAFLRNTLINAG